jgi:hypothetical protein
VNGRDLRLLVGAIGVSALGDFLALIPLALYLQETTGSGILVAALFVAIWSPWVFLAGAAGLLADRVDLRRLLVALLGGGLLIVALGARWTLFVAGAVPVLAGLVAIAVAWRRPEAPLASEAQAA